MPSVRAISPSSIGFGPDAEARRGRYAVRSGEEPRSEFFGHISLPGVPELLRPVSLGLMYGNSPLTYPYPAVRFDEGRALGALVGYAHFNGSMRHSTFLMCLALGKIDFTEVLAFGYLNTEGWYELLNAGLRFTGISGSDFPVQLARPSPNDWPSYVPLLGPERTWSGTKVEGSPYEAWASAVKKGGSDVIVTNGPLVDLKVDAKTRTATASARFFRPLESLEIVVNGKVIAVAEGDGRKTALSLSAKLPEKVSIWVAARVRAHKGPAGESDADIQAREETARKSPAYHLPALALKGEPIIQAHTNPVYVLFKGKPVFVPEARAAVAKRWEAELEYYRTAPLVFENEDQKRGFSISRTRPSPFSVTPRPIAQMIQNKTNRRSPGPEEKREIRGLTRRSRVDCRRSETAPGGDPIQRFPFVGHRVGAGLTGDDDSADRVGDPERPAASPNP